MRNHKDRERDEPSVEGESGVQCGVHMNRSRTNASLAKPVGLSKQVDRGLFSSHLLRFTIKLLSPVTGRLSIACLEMGQRKQ